MAERLRALPRPLLVVLGTLDRLVRDSATYVEALRDEGALLLVRKVKGGHAVNEERPEEVVAIVLDFLRGTDRWVGPDGQYRAR
jgi:pimeloyl-ACP methyl ester carboxylesterase